MSSTPTKGRPTVIPAIRYRDAPGAIDWLCKAFGFEKHLVVAAADGTIDHAQLTTGNGMIMVGSERDDEYGRLLTPPREAGGPTQGCYVVVPDADAHHARAADAGAEIVIAPADAHYGGRGYTCKDLEGHVWSFGTFDPWAEG